MHPDCEEQNIRKKLKLAKANVFHHYPPFVKKRDCTSFYAHVILSGEVISQSVTAVQRSIVIVFFQRMTFFLSQK